MLEVFAARGRVKNLLKLLAEEREILLKGPLSDLSNLAPRRDKLMESLENGNFALDDSDINAIRHEAGRNQSLLKASISGLQAARLMLSEQQRAATSMGTYTDSGERLEVPVSADLSDRTV